MINFYASTNKSYFKQYKIESYLIGFTIIILPLIYLPLFIQDYFFSKWSFLYLIISILVIKTFFYKKLLFPAFDKALIISSTAILSLLSLLFYENNIPINSPIFLDKIIFIFLVIFFFSFFVKRENYNITLFFICLSSGFYILTTIPSFILFLSNLDRNPLSTTFGNINMSAEFVGLVLAIQLGILARLKNKKENTLIQCLISASLIYCFYSSSRSIYLSFFSAAISLILIKTSFYKKMIYPFLFFLLFIFSVDLGNFLTGNENPQATLPSSTSIDLKKIGSSVARWEFIKGTIKLIIDHPTGVGSGRFGYASIPYLDTPSINEDLITTNPHNEYLRFLAEEGVLFCFLMFSTIIYWIRSHYNRLKQLIQEYPEVLSFFIFFAVQSAFQFPFLNAAPFFLMTIMLGFVLSYVYDYTILRIDKNPVFFITKGVISLLIITISASIIASEYLVYKYPESPEKNHYALKLNPENTFAVFNKATGEMNSGRFEEAKETLYNELSVRSNNFVAMSLLAQQYYNEGDIRKTCYFSKRIDALFHGRSRFHDFINEVCSSSPN